MSSRTRRSALLSLTLLITGCGSIHLPGVAPAAPASAPADSDAEPARTGRRLPIAISVTEDPAADTWAVGYVLPAEAAGVEFLAGRNAIRHERWGVGLREGEATWHVDRESGARERLCFSLPTRAFSVGFRTFADNLPKDYELNVTFSDGGRLLYTGHLLVRPLARCDAESAEAVPGEPEPRFTFTTTPTGGEMRTVRLSGLAGEGTLRWTPESEEAARTYVYFGSLEPVESEVATVILDPGLPAWMKEEMAETVPRLVERYTALTDTPLPFRPLLLVTWGGNVSDPGGSGRSFSGGTLPGLLQASASGPGWLERTEEARRGWFDRVAHETFHLWDGETFRPDDDSEWLSEAAADHFAIDAAIAFGLRSDEDAERWLIERANDCLVRLDGRSVRDAAGGSDYYAWYSCGAVALAAADGALRRADPPSDLAHLFRRLFEHAAATGSYGDAAFLGGLRELRAEEGAASEVRRLIGTGQPSRTDLFLQRVLGHAGIETVLVPPDEALADAGSLVEMTRRAVGRCWCGAESEPAEGSGCDPIETGKTLSAVEGESLGTDPLAAWRRVTEAAARRAALTVTLDGLETTLFCTDEIDDPTWTSLLAPAEPDPAS